MVTPADSQMCLDAEFQTPSYGYMGIPVWTALGWTLRTLATGGVVKFRGAKRYRCAHCVDSRANASSVHTAPTRSPEHVQAAIIAIRGQLTRLRKS